MDKDPYQVLNFSDGPNKKEKWKNLNEHQKYQLLLYDKVGGYYGWSVEEFLDTDPEIIEGLSELIDEKLAPYIEKFNSESDEPGKPPFSYFHLAILLALSALFGGKDKNSPENIINYL